MKRVIVQKNLDAIWGVADIAAYIGRERRSVYYLIRKGVIPVKRLGARTIMARRSDLDRALSQMETTDAA
jgi:hypothetical protein